MLRENVVREKRLKAEMARNEGTAASLEKRLKTVSVGTEKKAGSMEKWRQTSPRDKYLHRLEAAR